jgi:16S rRNA (guanine966-N2)-methyltransferase
MLRLTGGEFRGRSIQAPEGDRTRPTQAKLRQALFNSLQATVPDAKVLDLFAGSGALGFEALSRGAAQVVAVESNRSAIKLISKNADTLAVRDRLVIVDDPVEKSWPRLKALAPFDVVLADPPYAGGWEKRLLDELPWEELLAPDGVFCLEWGLQKSKVSELPDELPFLAKVREKTYGESVLTTYRRSS